jgi:diacylglycerol O-acyltransferase
MHMMMSMYSTNARNKVKESPLSMKAYQAYKKQMQGDAPRRVNPREDEIRAVSEVLKEQLGSTVNIAKAMRDTAGIWMGKKSAMAIPFHQVPKSALSTQLTGARRFVAQSWSFERVRAVGKAYDGTLNDAVMAMCAGALRKQLQDQRGLPKQSLKAMAPVSVRAAGDMDAANAVGMVCVDLATNVRDPARRIRQIKESMDAAKGQLQQMSAREIVVYTGITQAPLLLTQMTGQGSRFPAFSTVISNVPGPREKRYWNGARLNGMYPVSIPFDGAAANFTVVSNNENLDFGIVACRKSVPHVQRLIDYMEDSLVELEDAAGLRTKTGRRRTVKKAASGVKAGAKARTKAKAKTKTAAKTKTKATPKLKAKAKTKAKARPKKAGAKT